MTRLEAIIQGYYLGYMDGHAQRPQNVGEAWPEAVRPALDLFAVEAYEKGWNDCTKALPPGYTADPQPRAASTPNFFAVTAAVKFYAAATMERHADGPNLAVERF